MASDPMDDLPDDDELWRQRIAGSPRWESMSAKIAALTVERDELKADCSRLTTFGAEMQAERDEAIRELGECQRAVQTYLAAMASRARERDEARQDVAALLKAIAEHESHSPTKDDALFAVANKIAKRTGYAGGQGDE